MYGVSRHHPDFPENSKKAIRHLCPTEVQSLPCSQPVQSSTSFTGLWAETVLPGNLLARYLICDIDDLLDIRLLINDVNFKDEWFYGAQFDIKMFSSNWPFKLPEHYAAESSYEGEQSVSRKNAQFSPSACISDKLIWELHLPCLYLPTFF